MCTLFIKYFEPLKYIRYNHRENLERTLTSFVISNEDVELNDKK